MALPAVFAALASRLAPIVARTMGNPATVQNLQQSIGTVSRNFHRSEYVAQAVAGGLGQLPAGGGMPGMIASHAQQEGVGGLGEAKEIAGTAGKAAFKLFSGNVLGAAMELGKLPDMLKKFAFAVNEANRPLAEFSGKIAGAFARLDYGNVRRQVERAQATGNSSAGLALAVNDFKDRVAPAVNFISSVLNKFAVTVIDILSKMLDILIAIGEWTGIKSLLEKIAKWAEGQNKPPEGFALDNAMAAWSGRAAR